MIYIVELWSPTKKWLSLTQEARAEYVQNVGAAIGGLVEQGVEVITWSVNDKDIDNRGNFDYFAIWSFPNQEVANIFQKTVSGAGWYDYFDQINVGGKQESAENGLKVLVGLDVLQ